MRKLKIVIIIVGILFFLDLLTTLIAVNVFGVTEKNPIMAVMVHGSQGNLQLIAIKLGSIVSLVPFYHAVKLSLSGGKLQRIITKGSMGFLVTLYLVVVITNSAYLMGLIWGFI